MGRSLASQLIMIQAAKARHIFLRQPSFGGCKSILCRFNLWLSDLIIQFVVYLRINDFFVPEKCPARIMNRVHPSRRGG